jgi:hypothetical protein
MNGDGKSMDGVCSQPFAGRHPTDFEPGAQLDAVSTAPFGSLSGLEGLDAKLKQKCVHTGFQIGRTCLEQCLAPVAKYARSMRASTQSQNKH